MKRNVILIILLLVVLAGGAFWYYKTVGQGANGSSGSIDTGDTSVKAPDNFVVTGDIPLFDDTSTTIAIAENWLSKEGFTNIRYSSNQDMGSQFVFFDGTVAQMRTVFQQQYYQTTDGEYCDVGKCYSVKLQDCYSVNATAPTPAFLIMMPTELSAVSKGINLEESSGCEIAPTG